MAINRMRGWRRIGIALSVIWFIGFGGYLIASELDRTIGSFGRHLEVCWLVRNIHTTNSVQLLTKEERAQKQARSEEHTSELQSLRHLVCRLLLEKKKKQNNHN